VPAGIGRNKSGSVARAGERPPAAWGPRHVQAARPLLFERLTGDYAEPVDQMPADELYGKPELTASIERELGLLFNTRAPVDVETLDRRRRTTIDYGVPDLSLYGAGDGEARLALAVQLTRAIGAYEPRLMQPAVEIVLHPDRERQLVAIIGGTIRLHEIVERVSFRIDLPNGSERRHGD
jgi:type VI secretion system lysozyme-like protein